MIGQPIYKLADWVHKYHIVQFSSLFKNNHPGVEQLLDYINHDDLNWRMICSNSSNWAEDLIKANPDKINWDSLSLNTSSWAGAIIKKNLDKVNWKNLCLNNSYWVEDILLNINPDLINWARVNSNYNNFKKLFILYPHKLSKCCYYSELEWIGKIAIAHPEHISWDNLAINESDWSGKLHLENLDKINWSHLFSNSSNWASKLLLANIDKIDWYYICYNKNEWVRDILLANFDKIHWDSLSTNESAWAHDILLANPDKIDRSSITPNNIAWAFNKSLININDFNWNFILGHEYLNAGINISFTRCENFSKILKAYYNNKISWRYIFYIYERENEHPNEIISELVKTQYNNIDWNKVANTSLIFKYNYKKMKLANLEFKEELASAVYHPKKIERYLELYGNDVEMYMQ